MVKLTTMWDPNAHGPIPYTSMQEQEEERMREHMRRAGKAAMERKMRVFADRVIKAQRCLERIERMRRGGL